MEAQGAVDLELLLGEQLIGRGLVRVAREATLVVDNVVVLVTADRRLYVQQDAFTVLRIGDLAHGAMRAVRSGVRRDAAAFRNLSRGGARPIADLAPGQIDQNAEIDARVALQGDQRGE